MKAARIILLSTLVLILGGRLARTQAEDWTRFRGPNGQGVSSAKGIPSKWAEKDINWKVELEGKGHSSPVLWGQRIFLTGASENPPRLVLFCLESSHGQMEWRRNFDLMPYALHQFNTFASSTPAVDANRVYLSWLSRGHYLLAAFDHSGQKEWERDFGPFESQHGAGTSPIVEGDTVYLTKDPDGEGSFIALNAVDGKTRWQRPLQGARADYATPCLITPGPQHKPVLVFTSLDDGVLALDGETGAVAWQLEKVFTQRCVSSPVLAAGLIIGSCGSGAGGNYVAAVRPGNPAMSKKPEIAYIVRKSAPYVPTSVAFGDFVFLWSDGGIVSCVDAPTGNIRWQERVGGNYFASPICVDGRLFGVSNSGEVVVLEAAGQFRELARNSLNETAYATPAVSNGRLYLRTLRHLTSVGGRD